jgi:RNase P subunit RPR2
MQCPQVQPSPCPKCAGVRFLVAGSNLGVKLAISLSSLYCTSCGYVEFYASENTLEMLAQERAEAAVTQQERRRGKW